jgi:Tol biopolymer transport system component
VFVRDMQANLTRLVSGVPGGASTGNSGSYTPVLSADGRYVAFESDATNLVSRDGNVKQDIFLRDIQAGTTELASARSPLLPSQVLSPTGIESLQDMTPDGRYVAFVTPAGDLLSPLPTTAFNVWVRDRQTGAVDLVSAQSNGGDGGGRGPVRMSADGRFVAFVSTNPALDGSASFTTGGVFVRDRVTGVTRLISRNTATNASPNDATGQEIAVSADGRYVAFTSQATNLVSGITVPGGQYNLYLYDRQAGTLRMLNMNAAGTAPGNGGNRSAFLPKFSADGRTLVFETVSGDLIAGVADANNANDVFAYDTAAGTTRLVSVSTTANTAGNGSSGLNGGPQVSADGRYVVFTSQSTNLTTVPFGGFATDQVYRRDLVAGTTDLVSINTAGSASGNGAAVAPYVSADGRKVLFEGNSSNLTAFGATNNTLQLYLRDYTGAATVTLPAATPGSFFVIVEADRRRQVVNDTNRTNNSLAAQSPTAITIPTLTLNAPAAGSFTAAGQDRYFQVTGPGGRPRTPTTPAAST